MSARGLGTHAGFRLYRGFPVELGPATGFELELLPTPSLPPELPEASEFSRAEFALSERVDEATRLG